MLTAVAAHYNSSIIDEGVKSFQYQVALLHNRQRSSLEQVNGPLVSPFKAPSTRIRILLKTHLSYPFWVSVRTETVFPVTKNEAFGKRSPDLFENAVFMLSCRRVKTELLENADVTASIYDVPEHAHGSLGITQGHLHGLFSFFKVRREDFECSSGFVWTWIFFIRIKRCVFMDIRIRVYGT